MPTKQYKPTSPGRRNASVLDNSELTRKKPEKALTRAKKRGSGRNNKGIITVRFRGGGAKRKYRVVDFRRDKLDVPATVGAIEYDPNRTANIALLVYADGEKRYILAPEGLAVGATVVSAEQCEPNVGNCMPLKSIPLGLQVHNIELSPKRGGALVRGAGMVATLNNREGRYCTVTLPSGEMRRILGECRATIGSVGNGDHQGVKYGKAGRRRHMGRKPHNRGNAMNPVDHPLGGGEGHSNGGRHPCGPTGTLSKGGKTRKRRKASNKFIIRRRSK